MPDTPAQKRERRRKYRAFAIKYLGGKCVICGRKDNLEFHHKNPAEKEHNVIHYWKLQEINKCELRCVPCHDEYHKTKHGTHQRYYVHGCRCAVCDAGRIARQKARPSRAKPEAELIRRRKKPKVK